MLGFASAGWSALAAVAVPPFPLPFALDKGGHPFVVVPTAFAAGLVEAAMASSAIRFAATSLEGGPQP